MSKEFAIEVSGLTVNYERTPALWDISLEVPKGKLTAIIGPNGAGKSTLIKAALGLIKPATGKVLFLGEPLKTTRHQISYVPQRESVDWDFPITVFDLVLMGRYSHLGLFKRPSKRDKELAWKYLEQVKMDHLANRQIGELSGGQQQRVFIARSLCQEAEVYFFDEPFAGIDIASTKFIIELLHGLQKKGKSLFIVDHELATVPHIYDWVILLNMSLVANGDLQSAFNAETLSRAYGKNPLLLDEVIKLTKEKAAGYA